MASQGDPKKDQVDQFLDKGIKQIFDDLQDDSLPSELVDLLTMLKAQDQDLKGDK